MQKNNVISYRVEKCCELRGGLNIQLIIKADNLSKINLEKIDYTNSIALSEYSFALIENIFASEQSVEKRGYYHWGFHYHDISSVDRIILKLIALQKNLINKEKITFLWKSLDLLNNQNELKVINQGIIKLAWSTNEMRDELVNNIVDVNYRRELSVFLNEIVCFLRNGVQISGYQGIYVLGI